MLSDVDTRGHYFIVIALEFVLTMEILMTNKNNEMLVNDAYAYFKHRILTDNSICGNVFYLNAMAVCALIKITSLS